MQEQHSRANITKIAEQFAGKERHWLWQTLISPAEETIILDWIKSKLPTMVSEYLPNIPPDLALFELSQQALTQSGHQSRIIATNHPLNYLRYIHPARIADAQHLLTAARADVDRNPELRAILTNYESALAGFALWDSWDKWDPLDNRQRELFLASLEQIIAHLLGGLVMVLVSVLKIEKQLKVCILMQ